MKFSELPGKAKKNGAQDTLTRGQENVFPETPSAEAAHAPAFPPSPLNTPLPELPEASAAFAWTHASPTPGTGAAGDAESPTAGTPGNQPASRKYKQKRDESALRAAARPFGELDEQAREAYARNLSLAKELISRIDRPYVESYERIMRRTELNSRVLSENPVLLSHTSHSTADDYLYAHSANVAIISQALGLALGLEAGMVNFIGFCGMAHDIGMTGFAELAAKEARLTDAEYAELTLHSEHGAAKMDRILDIPPRLKDQARETLMQVHERAGGGGYPRRVGNEEIALPAQIIGIADVYEAMTHPRAWRAALHPHNVIKHLIDKEGEDFNSRVVKALIETLSIYPPGSLIALSTGEIATVARTNKEALTRPVVSVLLGPDFAPVPPRLIDLMEHPLTGIERIVEAEELSARNPKYAAKLELARWWVDW